MRWEKFTKRRGFTLTEIMVAIAMSTIVIGGIGVVLVDSQRGWHRMYNRVFSDVVTDSYVARKAFDAVVRKSSIKRYGLGSNFVMVYYYQDSNSTKLDGFAVFSRGGEELQAVYGELDANGTPLQGSISAMTLARNVAAANFSVAGPCVQMILELDNGKEAMTVTCSAVRHNE